ncbi:MAG: hypothetical protein V4449_03290 [Patescibacteria group bacterium]
MAEGVEKPVLNSTDHMSEKHRKIFIGLYLLAMAGVLVAGTVANYLHAKPHSK